MAVLLVPFIPIAIVLELAHAAARDLRLLRARRDPDRGADGPSDGGAGDALRAGIGGFLNVTFGNAPEIIIALFALHEGLQEVVKASLVGSILGNILLVMGAAMFVGGLERERQKFDRTAANVQALMLMLAAVALAMPAMFQLVAGVGLPAEAKAVNFGGDIEHLSIAVSIVLLITYFAGLLFSLRTHKDLFNPEHGGDEHEGEPWTVRRPC